MSMLIILRVIREWDNYYNVTSSFTPLTQRHLVDGVILGYTIYQTNLCCPCVYRLLVNEPSAGCGLLSSALAACRPVPHWHWVIAVHAISQPPYFSETRFLLNHPVFPHASRWLRGLIVMFQ